MPTAMGAGGREGTPADPWLDAGERPLEGRQRWPSRRLALGLSPTPRFGLALLFVGMALGPYGLRVLSEPVLASLDPAVSGALVALGVLVGLDLKMRRWDEGRLLAMASLDAGITILIVGIGIVVVQTWWSAAGHTSWLLALMLGICAAPSSTPTDDDEEAEFRPATRVGDLNDVLPIVLSMVGVAWARPDAPTSWAWLLAQAALLTVAIAIATRWLITQTSAENEQRVFVIGALLLLGGAAAYLSLSTLLVGLLAGVFWSVSGGPARERVARDVRYLQHPLTVLLLVVAGARFQITSDLLAVVVVYAVLRMAGKLAGGWLAARTTPDLPRGLGFFLSAPGVVGIAIALDVLHAGADIGTTIVTIVIAGSLGAELFSILLAPRQDNAT